ncbi:SRPBCC family protein [Halorubellus sp. PRR65]|uniref:SRPBCC family protein n=1 Tax=Halorubellus sp. PRR65 TaxID=3098148 RepID=UPI002B25984D|nr:SRPBCC family protein [Halorubellus sp. PRR65]
MTVTVERTFTFDAAPEDVWAFISDAGRRAEAISVVESYDIDESSGGDRATWHVSLPIPVISRTAAVQTRDVDRRDGEYVKFVGRSKVMRVVGEHEVVPTEGGCELVNRFRVEGKLPGVERYFKKNLDGELDNLEAALRADLGLPA